MFYLRPPATALSSLSASVGLGSLLFHRLPRALTVFLFQFVQFSPSSPAFLAPNFLPSCLPVCTILCFSCSQPDSSPSTGPSNFPVSLRFSRFQLLSLLYDGSSNLKFCFWVLCSLLDCVLSSKLSLFPVPCTLPSTLFDSLLSLGFTWSTSLYPLSLSILPDFLYSHCAAHFLP